MQKGSHLGTVSETMLYSQQICLFFLLIPQEDCMQTYETAFQTTKCEHKRVSLPVAAPKVSHVNLHVSSSWLSGQGSILFHATCGGCHLQRDDSLLRQNIEFCQFLLISLIPYSKNGERGLNPLYGYFYNVLFRVSNQSNAAVIINTHVPITQFCHILKYSVFASYAFLKMLQISVNPHYTPPHSHSLSLLSHSKGNHSSAFAMYMNVSINNMQYYVACFRKRVSHRTVSTLFVHSALCSEICHVDVYNSLLYFNCYLYFYIPLYDYISVTFLLLLVDIEGFCKFFQL